ncbi:mCG148378 [Mus musculus]|nr:mCG148378 [Mus musculus]
MDSTVQTKLHACAGRVNAHPEVSMLILVSIQTQQAVWHKIVTDS